MIFQGMYRYRQFDSWRDYDELKRMLGEAIERGFVGNGRNLFPDTAGAAGPR